MDPACVEAGIEAQARARVHRLGQTRPVTVLRLFTRRTIEEVLAGDKNSSAEDMQDTADRRTGAGTDTWSSASGGVAIGDSGRTGKLTGAADEQTSEILGLFGMDGGCPCG